MLSVLDLWLPILLSAVAVFIVSSIIHMVLPYHRSNFKKLEKETEFTDAVRPLNISPGEYMFPFATDMKEMGSESHMKKLNDGPVGWMTVLPNGPIAMGKSLGMWFVYSILVGVFAAYIATRSLGTTPEFMNIVQMTAASSFSAYAFALMQNSIWMARAWSTTAKFMFDGLVYATTTGFIFASMWPS